MGQEIDPSECQALSVHMTQLHMSSSYVPQNSDSVEAKNLRPSGQASLKGNPRQKLEGPPGSFHRFLKRVV